MEKWEEPKDKALLTLLQSNVVANNSQIANADKLLLN